MKMSPVWNWNALTEEPVGIDGNGGEVSRRTTFGHFVAGAGAPVHLTMLARDRILAANFLREWANRLVEGVNFDDQTS